MVTLRHRRRVGFAMLKTAVIFAAVCIGLAMLAPVVLPMMGEAAAPPVAASASASTPPPVAVAAASAQTHEHEIALPANRMGHYTADVLLNGQSVPMMIDTGATLVVLSADVADRIGLRPPPNARRVQTRTANGLASATLVSLDSVEIGPIFVPGVQAMIADRSAGDVNLVGMSLLSRLNGVEQRDGFLYLRQ
jgi:aspartyl protease family protein